MKQTRPPFLLLLFVLGIQTLCSQEVVWQMHHGQGAGIYVPGPDDPPLEDVLRELVGNIQHGDSGGYQYANIPPADDADWEPAPVDPEDGQLCFRLDRSRLEGYFTGLDFTYFQTVITVDNLNESFAIRYLEVDDGVRAYVFNSANPEGAFIPGGDARLYFTPKETDLTPLFVEGENRIVLVQFDNAITANYLKAIVVREDCDNDVEAPELFNVLEDGTRVPLSEYLEEEYDCGAAPDLNYLVVDNCDPDPTLTPTVTNIPNSNGSTTVILDISFSDASGNANREVYTYRRTDDDEDPRIVNVLPDGTEVSLAEFLEDRYDCGETPTLDLRAVDNCDPDPVLADVFTDEPNPDGTVTVRLELTATDASGNTTSENYSFVTSDDQEPPRIVNVLSDGTEVSLSDYLQDEYLCGEEPELDVRIVDDCDSDPIVAATDEVVPNADGTLTRTLNYTITDASGNETQESYAFILAQDTVAPQILNVLPDGTLVTFGEYIQEGYDCGEIPEITVRYVDDCDPNPIADPIRIVERVESDSTRTETWTIVVRDASGNEAREVFTYALVDDTEDPVLSGCPDTLTVTLDLCNEYDLTVEALGITATDDCTDSVGITLSTPLVSEAGNTTVTVTAADAQGNTATCDVVVVALTNPQFITVTALDDSLNTSEGQALLITAAELLANDTVSDGSNLEIQDLMLVNPEDGTLTDNGDGTYTFVPATGFAGLAQLTYIAKSEDESLFFSETGNFYEFVVENGISWSDARVAAEARTLNGINGYLATITSQAENDHIFERLAGNGWIGASDAEAEGVWKWVTGPEAGQQFWQGLGINNGGMPVNGMYNNWDVSGNFFEPNNLMITPEGENYAHLAGEEPNNAEAVPGTWNDWPNERSTIQGYIVEYGGVGGCTPDFVDEATVVIRVEGDPCLSDMEDPAIFQETEDGTLITLADFLQETYDCGRQPVLNVVATDNCDPDPIVLAQGNTSPQEGGTRYVGTYTATDASGNQSMVSYDYFVADDAEAPVLMNCPATLTVMLDECNQYELTVEELGVTATDNCTDSVGITIVPSLLESAGTTTVSVRAVDDAGISSICEVVVTAEALPGQFSVTAGDDDFTATAGQPFTFSDTELLGNDMASDGAELAVQDVSLVNPADGTLVDNQDGTYTFTPAPGFTGAVMLTYVAKSADGSLYYPETGHFYEFVADPQVSWVSARNAAAARDLNGLSGYLATVTSEGENEFIRTRLEGTGWMGASDAALEGTWRWVTGPEAGTEFWMGGADGNVVGDGYANWNAGEPNNDTSAGNTAGENYGHFRTDGTWNDWPNFVPTNFGVIQGYVVEYSGPDGCVPPDFTATGNVTINYPTGLTEGGNAQLQLSAYPNPFRGETTLAVENAGEGPITVEVRNPAGRLVQTTRFVGNKEGTKTLPLRSHELWEGIYFVSVRTATKRKTIRISVRR